MGQDVARDLLVTALRAGDVNVTQTTDLQTGKVSVRFVKGLLAETQILTEVVPHRLAMRLLCKFDVDRTWAWHPERIPAEKLPPTITAN